MSIPPQSSPQPPNPPLVEYVIARTSDLPPIHAAMYEYVLAGNGVFVRGQREGLAATIKVAKCFVRGLAPLQQSFQFNYPRVPASVLTRMLQRSRTSSEGRLFKEPKEILFHLCWDATIWQLIVPPQSATPTTVQPLGNSLDSSYERALIECHSHHWMSPYFSTKDNAEETGFRIFAVLGHIFTMPSIRVRIGLYGHFLEIPANTIFELPETITDAFSPQPLTQEDDE